MINLSYQPAYNTKNKSVEKLNYRQKTVLKEVCKNFIETGAPVGSRSISKSGNLTCSPATIRNEMADLETMGFLCSPHTSAGRIPTEKGYKFYVNFLIDYERISLMEEALIERIQKKSAQIHYEQQDILKSAIQYACQTTHLAGLALIPQQTKIPLKKVQFHKVVEDKAMLILVDELDNITDQIVKIPANTPDEILEKLSILLNAQLCHLKYHQFEQDYIRKTKQLLSKYNSLLTQLVKEIRNAARKPNINGLFLEGFVNFFDQPEFNDPEKMKEMISLLDQKESLLDLLAKSLESSDEIMVNIGSDSGLEVKDLSIVTAKYEGPNKSIGQIGLIGPLRMDYGRVVATLARLSTTLSKLLISDEMLIKIGN